MAKRVLCIVLTLIVAFSCAFALTACVKKIPSEKTLDAVLEEGGYKLVFADEFDGDSVDYTKWRTGYQTPSRRAAYYEDSADTLFVSDGALTITKAFPQSTGISRCVALLRPR